MPKTFTIEDNEPPWTIRLGENQRKRPVIAYYKDGEFLFQFEFDEDEYERCRKFFNMPFSSA